MSIRVVIADDHQILVAALQALLARDPEITVVGTAHDGTALLKLIANTGPDVAVVDIGMPGMNGIEAIQRLASPGSATRVIVLTGYSERHYVLEALDAGAAGYVLKSSAVDALPRAIHNVAQGRTYLCPEVAGAVVANIRGHDRSRAKADESQRLAPRERIIVRLLSEGKTSAQIAAQLHSATSTVDTHRRNIMRKLQIHNVAELTRYAIREGITSI